MAVDPLRDVGTIYGDESGWGGNPARINTSGDFTHLPKRERAKAKKHAVERQQKWKKALAVRDNWTPEQFADEESRLAQEVADFVASKAA